jgi:hypothetical protein
VCALCRLLALAIVLACAAMPVRQALGVWRVALVAVVFVDRAAFLLQLVCWLLARVASRAFWRCWLLL